MRLFSVIGNHDQDGKALYRRKWEENFGPTDFSFDRGDIVDEYTFRVIESLQKENEKRNTDEMQVRLTVMGHVLYVSMLIIFLTVYITLFRRDYFEKPRTERRTV